MRGLAPSLPGSPPRTITEALGNVRDVAPAGIGLPSAQLYAEAQQLRLVHALIGGCPRFTLPATLGWAWVWSGMRQRTWNTTWTTMMSWELAPTEERRTMREYCGVHDTQTHTSGSKRGQPLECERVT